jgi:hypothetical protein
VRPYFSQKESQAFVAGIASQMKLSWLALSGEVLSDKDSAELQQVLEQFFRSKGHHSFRQHGV